MENTIDIQPSNCEKLTLKALDKLDAFKGLNPHTLRLIMAVVYNVCDELENTEQLKKHLIKIN